MDQSSFATKFISRLNRIDQPRIESFLTRLVREKDLQRAIFDSLEEGLVVTDEQDRIIFSNDACVRLLGSDPREHTGEPVRSILKAPVLQELAEEFAEERQQIRNREIRLRTPAPRVYSLSVVPLTSGEDDASHAVWIISDQTDKHRRALQQQQLESIQSLATLTAGIAHEIKNPLNSLNIHAQLIAQSVREMEQTATELPGMDRLQRSNSVMLEEIQRLTRIVDQFIKAARPIKPSLVRTDLNQIIRDVAQLLEPECDQRQITLETDLDPVMPRLDIDPEQIKQAVLNLAKNAMEAMDKPNGRIVLRTLLRSDAAHIEVEDNGCGIQEEDRLRIFEPYQTTKFEGSGLGLMVVFRIVRAHEGAMGLDSAVGEGSVFRIALPLDERPVRLLEGTVSTVVPEDVVKAP